MNIQGWFPLGLTGLISLLSKGLSWVFSSTTVQKHQFFSVQSSLWSNAHIIKRLIAKELNWCQTQKYLYISRLLCWVKEALDTVYVFIETLGKRNKIYSDRKHFMSLPGDSVVKNPVPQQETWVRSLVREDPTCCRATKPVWYNQQLVLHRPETATTEPTCHSYWSLSTL